MSNQSSRCRRVKSRESRVKSQTQRRTENPAALDPRPSTLDSIDWSTELQPRGTQTRLGQALADELRLYRDAPLAGIVVISDGAQNAGIEPGAAIEAARQAEGAALHDRRRLGRRRSATSRSATSSCPPALSRTIRSTSPATCKPTATPANRSMSSSRAAARKTQPAAARPSPRNASRSAPMAKWSRHRSTSNQASPARSCFKLRVKAPPDDGNPRDNEREAEIEVVDRKTRVLLFASGPMRDYQFLRNQLHRDATMIIDVLLQTGQPGISQDANTILDHFPSTAEELYQYDCIVAFDPDWTKLDAAQVELVEKWVSEEAGGLIAVAGPIQTPRWIRSTEHAKLRDLYPVVFQNRMTLMDDGQYRRRYSLAARVRARRPRSQVPLARQDRRRQRSRLGQLPRRLRLSTP